MAPLLPSTLFGRRLRTAAGSRRRGRRSAGGQPGIEGLESRAMLAGDDPLILVGLVGNRVMLTLDPKGVAITNLATTYDAPAAKLTITAATAGSLAMAAPVNGISVNPLADTITVDLRKITKFAGLSIVGGANTDSVRIGPGGVNLAAVGRGAAAQGLFIDTGAGSGDSIAIAGQIVAKGTGAVRLATQGASVAHGILMASNVVTARGSQSFGGGVTLLNGVALQAGGDISFSSTIDGYGRLQLSAGRAITMAGDVGSWLPLPGITLAKAGRVLVGAGLVLDGSGTAAGTSGFVIGANVHNVVFSSVTAARTISGFGGAGIRFAGGSNGSRITGMRSMGNGVGLLVGPGVYSGTVISGSSFSDNVGHGVSLQAARCLTIGGRTAGAGNEIVSNGGFGVAATGPCTGSLVVGSEIGDNALGQVENYLASALSGNLLVQDATGLLLQLNDVGRAAYRAQKARSYSFDVGVEAFVVSARSTGWLDTRTAALDIDASVGFMVPPPGAIIPAGMQRTVLGENSLATSLTPVQTLPGIEFARSVQYVGSDSFGRHYRAVVGVSTFAGMIPLADLQAAPGIGGDGSPVPVDVWLNAQGDVRRIAGTFAGGAFTMMLRGQGATGFVPAMAPAQAVGMNAASARSVPAAGGILGGAEPSLPGMSNGVSGVQVGRSTLVIPYGDGVAAPADWYFPTQVDGAINAQGVIWLQHATGATGNALAALAVDLARQTNSIVVAPSLPTTMSWSLADFPARRAVASLFEGDRSALVGSAVAAGYVGDAGVLTGKFVLAGHSAGGGFVTAVGANYAMESPSPADLVGVIMYDGVSRGAFDGSGSFAAQVAQLDARSIPVYQLAAPAQLWNAYGATTNALVATDPGRFRGAVLAGGSHVDAMVGGDPSTAIVAQRVTTPSLPGNAAAARTLTAGWINDLYVGAAPDAARYGLYAAANQPILMGYAAANPLPSPVANMWSATQWRLDAELAAIGGLTGFDPGPVVNSGDNGLSGAFVPPQESNGVTGVKIGASALAIPCGPRGYVTSAEWYFPTQADGRIAANGVVWLQCGEVRDAAAFAALATRIAGQTNSIVVAPAISWFEIPTRPGCFLGGASMQQAVADMMLGDRGALAVSATAAGYEGVLPEKILLAGQRLGGGFATEVAARTVVNGAAANLLGVVMVDGVAGPGQFALSVDKLDSLDIPIYQIASPPQAANDWGRTTEQLAALRPDQFVGVQFDDGSPMDAVITLATGWINDFYAGRGPTDPVYGIYGNPNDGNYVPNQPLVLGGTGATTLPAPPPVDINQYLGRWYEQGSVKQEPSNGLVNVKTEYKLQEDGTIKVTNSGNYGPNGPAWNTTGSAVPVNAANTRWSVAYSGVPTRSEPGNYWILDYAPDYSWAIVGNSTGTSGTILTRDQVVSGDEYNALVARAYRLGVRRTITPTAQYPAV